MKLTFNGPTPNGGTKTIICYMDEYNREVDKQSAKKAVITELDNENNIIKETFGRVN